MSEAVVAILEFSREFEEDSVKVLITTFEI